MRRLALQLCVVATAHSARLVYTTPGSAERLEICVPAKAGSTTIFHALHRAIVGTEFNASTSPARVGPTLGYVQNVAAWSRERACDQSRRRREGPDPLEGELRPIALVVDVEFVERRVRRGLALAR
ncbi:unnamed protein product [Pelagomonas calceolata]|uniref:Sulfotransferase n=1 Tax=Pelagomonas calceolata TaxID=35677 RepID=A0A8J2SWQ1_9STRA|nr:unnamed protein product [Pelagomonas calceolata]